MSHASPVFLEGGEENVKKKTKESEPRARSSERVRVRVRERERGMERERVCVCVRARNRVHERVSNYIKVQHNALQYNTLQHTFKYCATLQQKTGNESARKRKRESEQI